GKSSRRSRPRGTSGVWLRDYEGFGNDSPRPGKARSLVVASCSPPARRREHARSGPRYLGPFRGVRNGRSASDLSNRMNQVLPVGTLLEKLGFRQLVEETLDQGIRGGGTAQRRPSDG